MKRAISINIIVLMLLSVVLSSSIYCEGSEVKNETEEYINEILSCGKSHAALVDSDGTIKMWGSNKDIPLGYFGIPFGNPYSVIFDELENYKAVAAGAHHTVAIKKDGTVWMSDNYKEPYQVENLEKVSAVSAGFNFSVAVENGKVWCWQFGSAWQLGLENIRSVSAGYDHALALSNTGKVYAWGDNQYGQLGNELTSKADQPVVIEDLQNIKSISAGQKFSAALTNDGSVMVWGNLPWNDTDNVKKAPVELEGLSDIKEIACGYDHMLALKSDGTVWAIGLNKYGQLGDGSKNARNTPVMVKNIDNISTVSAGDSFSLAMTNDGSLWAWGLNNMGQLRDMTYYDSVIPVLCYVDKEKPSAPYDIEVEVVGGSAHLSWKGSKDNTGVLKYYIFRDGEKISSEDVWDYYDQQWYTDEGLKVGESFDYFVKAIDFEGNMSEASETIRIDIGKDTQPPDIPEDIRVNRNAETDTFTISWSYCYDDFEVKEYELIMNGKTIASGSHFEVGTFDGCPTSVLYDLNFDFEIGEKYVFTVKAIDTSGNFSESEPFEFFDSYGNSIKDAFFVSVVDNVYGKILNGKIDYIDDVDFLSFKVNSSGTYTIKTESDNKISLSLSDSEENIINRINGKNSSFTADLIKGEDYYLEIGDAWYYTPGYRICFIKEDNTPPTEVTDLSLAVKNGSIALNWSASKDNIGVKGYRVYRNDEEIGVTDIPYFADEDMGNTEKYKYMVKAFDFSGNLSKEGNIAGNLTDLVVEAVNAPKTAYSGGKLSIDWVVKNVGYTDTTDTLWYDSIYISQSNVFDVNTSELLGRVANKSFLAEAESYRAEEEFDLPKGISGEYYIHVITDSYDKLYELKASNNAGISEAFNVILSPSPDLKVTSITVPSTSFTGMAVEVAWTVKNQGDGATEGTWRDKIYISKAPNFDEGNARLIGSKTYNLRLAAGEEYSEKMDVSIIDAVYGNHYIFVEADANNSVYEHAGEANNVSEAAEINLVLRPYADLEVVSVSAADSTVAGSSIDVSWRVENKGFASTVEGSWTDCIYVSTSPYLDGSAVAVATVYHSGNLVKGESYTVEKNILLPKGLSGKYYILVYSDYSNKVFEFNSKDNNVGLSKAIDIKPAVIDAAKDIKEDVAIINAEISHSEANSGESVNVKWEVRNVSEDDMERERWVDGVYLSKSGNLDNGDYTILASSSNNIILSSGEGYSRDINVEIPKGISGKYYIIVSSDIYRSIYDVNRENNTYCISTPLNISLSPSPDIKLASVTTEVYGISGQPLDISWEVLNKGNAPTDSLWYDSVYLSKDEFYDNNDSCLSSMKNKKQLNVGESYSNTSTIEIPSEVSGNYYLLLRADSRDDIYEYNAEENNIEVVNVEIIKLPPADLKVHSIHVPEKAVPGEKVTINWNVVNKGISKAKGYMTDSIYISEDKTWDINDIHFGDLRYSIDLETNFEVENHLTSEMPGTVPGDYYVIIKTDILNQIPESNNLNNAGVSVETINADMKKLKMGETEEFYLNRGSYRYYKISAEEGTDILVKLDSKSEISSNELFVSYGEVPDRGSFDYCFAIQNEADQEIIIPDTKQGDYYITAYCSGKTDAGNLCTLEARVMDFQLRRLGINEGGQGGTVTVELHGTKMSKDVKALLKNDSFTVSSSVYWINNSLILATFDLSEAPLGIYDVIISEDEKESILEDSFTVAKTKFNALEVDTSLPRNITPWSIGLFEVNYYNAGNTNSYTPVLKLSADNALLKLNDESDFKVNNVIVPVESKYLPDIIKPGDRGIIYVFFKPTSSSGTNINFTVENIKNILSDTDEKSEAIEAEGAQSVENEIEYVSTTSSLLSEAYDENEMKIPDSIAFSANTDELEIINYDNVYSSGYKLIQWDKPLQPSSWYNVKDKTSGGDALKKMEVNNSFKCELSSVDTITLDANLQFDKKINDLGIKGSIIRTTKEIAMSGAMHRQEIKLNDKTNSQVVNYKYIPMYIKHYYDKFGIYKNKNIPGSQIIKKIGTGSENKYTNSGEAEFTEAIIGGYVQFGIPILWGPEKPLRAGVNYSIDPESITLLAKDVYFTEDLVIQSLEKKASGSSTIDLSNLVRIEKSDGYETSVNLFLGGSYANEVGSGYEQTGNITIELNNGKNYRIDCKRYINYYIVKYNIMETELETINGMGNVFLTTKSPKYYTTAVVKIPCGIIFEAEITDIDPFNQQASTNVVASLDPNDIIGPEGFGEENMIKDEETLDYKIRFENDAQKALSPAQKVCIEQELDKNLDLSTFRLGSFGFGQHIFEVPENRTYYQKRIDLREEMGLYLNVNAGIDVMSGKAFWLFESIDPETGRTPEDPLRGFLPVNLKDSEGEGFVTYTIKPAKNLKTSERVEAQAVIVFDRNEPIDTPLIFNTVDCGNPVSSVKKLPEETNTNEINIEWNSMDDQNGSGVKGVDLYISKNDSDYTLLESGIKENRYKYKGDNGNKYSFFSIARDNVGNVEEMKNSGEASTKVFIPDETEENTLIENPENITEGGGGTDTTPTSTSAPTSTPKPTSKDSSKSSSAGSNKSSSSTSTSTTPVDNDALQKETGSTEKTAVPEVTKPVTIEETKEAIPAVGIFSDLKNHWAEKFVAALIEKRIIEGYPDGTIKPDANLSRSEAVVLLVRALGLEQKDSGDIAFSDLSEIPQWSRGFVKTAFDKGIIKGYGNNTFRPLNSVTREEIIVMLMNAFGYEQLKETEELYKDGSEISAWARGYVSAASKLKIIRGYEDNTLRPDSTVTRAEVFTMINNCLELNNQPQ